jgi:hypothetical protein
MKTYKMRGQTVQNGKNAFVDLNLEFEGKRVFAIWDTIPIGNYQLKARLEIDPRQLKRTNHTGCDFLYEGELVLPRPENN